MVFRGYLEFLMVSKQATYQITDHWQLEPYLHLIRANTFVSWSLGCLLSVHQVHYQLDLHVICSVKDQQQIEDPTHDLRTKG